MRYCHECGSKLEAGDIFCTNCGTKQIQASSAEEKQFIKNNNSGNSNTGGVQHELASSYRNLKDQVSFSGVGDILLKMLVRPVFGAKKFVENGEKGSVIAITVLLTIIQGLLGVLKVNQVISSLQNTVIDFIQKIIGFMNIIQPGASEKMLNSRDIMEVTTQINKVKSFIDIPYGKIFLQNSSVFLISIAILFVIIYLGTNISSKNKSEAFTIYKAALIVSVPTLYFELFSILCSYVSFYIGLGVASIGIIVSLCCLNIVIKDKLRIDENHSVFIVSLSCIAVFVGVSMCLQSFVTSNISDIIMSVTNIMKTFKY